MHTFPSRRSSKPVRRMTICSKTLIAYCGRREATAFPILSLCGKWLQESGFKIGHIVNVACERGKLTITLSEQQLYVDV